MSDTNLGLELQQLSHLLEALIIKEPDIDKAKQLREQHFEVLEKIRKLVDGNVAATTEELKQATESVEKANGQVIDALKDLQKVAETINTTAKVLETLGKLAAMAA
jgi:ABC-type transporter Mla subunit MlaD